jgi:ferredoxin
MKYEIDRDRCRGHAVCEMMAPDTFRVESDGIAVVLEDDVAQDPDAAAEAMESCPANAIRRALANAPEHTQ